MKQKEKYIPTGNKMISIPDIRESDAAIMGITFLHMGSKGLIEIRGEEGENPLLKPYVLADNREVSIENIHWDRLDYWIPRFRVSSESFEVEGVILAPIDERGFIYHLKIRNKDMTKKEITIGLKGCWSRSIHEINENKDIHANKCVYHSNWNNNLIFDLRDTFNIFSFAPIFEEPMDVTYVLDDEGANKVEFTLSKTLTLESGQEYSGNYYWGLGFEEVGSTTAAKEMLRKGYEYELDITRQWLSKRTRTISDSDMNKILNTNLFFNFFFASGMTMDTEEFVLVTSRSPRYYVSAAYWDRDSLLWSFPSILLVDSEYAKEMLDYVFEKQIKNVGIHSRYIDGAVLEPGFELDELCAPIIALNSYIKATQDYDILKEAHIAKGINRILKILETKKHPNIDLYETFLQPTDDYIVHPYLTYNNVLVWKILRDLGGLFRSIGKEDSAELFLEKSKRTEKAIWENCKVEYEGQQIFAWSLDLQGKWNIYDEPPGSLQLLPYYGFCEPDNVVYQNTVKIIRDPQYPYSFHGCNIAEIGCEHAPHPWILSVANSLLCGRKEQCKDILLKAEMDNGIACESVDENTGECATGEAFATCAGFLAYAIYYAFGNE